MGGPAANPGILHSMIPTLRALALSLGPKKLTRRLPSLIHFFSLMREWGVDPDPENTLILGVIADVPPAEFAALQADLRQLGLNLQRTPPFSIRVGRGRPGR
jgi:hypothetical protein